MSSTTTSIFTFDHGQKKMNKAIGVEEVYMDDLQEQIADLLKNYLFDEDRNIKDDLSPSMLIELALHEFSYNQLVVIAGMYLQQRLDGFTKMMEEKLKGVVKKISLDADDVPEDIRDLLIDLAEQAQGDRNVINGDDLPQEVKDFLDSIARNSEDADDDD
jgi:hypothetical protein